MPHSGEKTAYATATPEGHARRTVEVPATAQAHGPGETGKRDDVIYSLPMAAERGRLGLYGSQSHTLSPS